MFIVFCHFDIVRFKMSCLRKSVKKQLPSTKRAGNRKEDSCKDKNEGILHILVRDFFFQPTLMAK